MSVDIEVSGEVSPRRRIAMKFLPLLLVVMGCLGSSGLFGQSLTVELVGSSDTTGFSVSEYLSMERSVVLSLPLMGSATDTLIVELGPTSDSYDLFVRRFPLGQTGTFDDGCSLTLSGEGVNIGLGNFTGLSTFYVRACLASTGLNSVVYVSSE